MGKNNTSNSRPEINFRLLLNRGVNFWLLLLATIALAITFLKPMLPLRKSIHRYLFIIDVTQSMNARDYVQYDMPPDRLSFAKASIVYALHDFPCGSEVGLGIFSSKGILVQFEPLEICRHFGVIDDVLAHIDWRMAWAGDSNVSRGLYRGIKATINLSNDTRLAFFTDGEQTVTELHSPPLKQFLGKVEGTIVGVGSTTPAPLAKLDIENDTIIGYWKENEVGNILSATGFHRMPADRPRNNNRREETPVYLSSLREINLKQLATITGLEYHRLQSSKGLSQALRPKNSGKIQTVKSDIRWFFALIALILVLASWAPTRR